MKAHHRKHHAKGGKTHKVDPESVMEHGDREWEQDERDTPEERVNAPKIFGEAKQKKHGGRTKRKHGGMIHKHHEAGEHMKHAKHIGMVHGHRHAAHAGRKPRKSGGRAGSDMNPLSSAHKGQHPAAHKDAEIE